MLFSLIVCPSVMPICVKKCFLPTIFLMFASWYWFLKISLSRPQVNVEARRSWCLQIFTNCSTIWCCHISHNLAKSSSEFTLKMGVESIYNVVNGCSQNGHIPIKVRVLTSSKNDFNSFGAGLVNITYENFNHCLLLKVLPAGASLVTRENVSDSPEKRATVFCYHKSIRELHMI